MLHSLSTSINQKATHHSGLPATMPSSARNSQFVKRTLIQTFSVDFPITLATAAWRCPDSVARAKRLHARSRRKALGGRLVCRHGWRFDPSKARNGRHGPHPPPCRSPRRETARTSLSQFLQFRPAFYDRRVASAGFGTDGRGFLLDKKLPEPGKMHEVERFFTLAHSALLAWGAKPAWDDVPPNWSSNC